MRESFQSTPSLTSLSSNQMLLVHNCALSQSEARSTWIFFAGGYVFTKICKHQQKRTTEKLPGVVKFYHILVNCATYTLRALPNALHWIWLYGPCTWLKRYQITHHREFLQHTHFSISKILPSKYYTIHAKTYLSMVGGWREQKWRK